jgi:CRP-like cAMP-binding protein
MDFSTELKELFLTVHHIQKVEKGAYLFQAGSAATELFFIQSGKVQVSKVISDGRELTLRMCSDGDLVGELSLFSHSPSHTLNAKVVEGGEVAVIYLNHLEEKLAKNHELALEFIKWLSLEHRKTQTKFRDLILHGKKGALIST